jgi:HAE1 family hydrophobic/amphiphilic exporter-1
LELPQLSLEVDRVRAAHLGIPASEVALALSVMAGGVDYAKFNDSTGDGERYNIRLKANDGMFTTDKDLSKIYLRSAKGDLVRFDTLAHFNTTVGSAVINRFDLQYAAYFYATPTMALGDALEKVKEESKSILPAGYQIHFIGEAEEFAKTAGYMGFVFLMALTFLYIVLASQFNSFVQPLVIMVAQPLAIIGGVFALWLTGHSLNIFSMIGLVLLMGLVAKNSILLIDKTNQLREEGVELTPALMSACPERLRPILMTSLTIIFALFPAAIGVGSGAATNAPLAVAVIGGMITSTLLSLVVVPAVYSLVEEGLFKKPIALIMHFYKLIFKPRHLIRP